MILREPAFKPRFVRSKGKIAIQDISPCLHVYPVSQQSDNNYSQPQRNLLFLDKNMQPPLPTKKRIFPQEDGLCPGFHLPSLGRFIGFLLCIIIPHTAGNGRLPIRNKRGQGYD